MNRPRGRGRRNKSNTNKDNTNPNKHYDSNGPDVRIRGSAKQVLDKYQQYASDALRGGDRIAAEGYFQHAEHYQRIVYEIEAAVAKQREEREARNAERDAKRREEREARAEAEESAEADSSESTEVDTAEDAATESVEKEEKPKRRKTYKKKEKAEVNGALDEDDGVLKTVTRGRKKKSAKDEAEAAAE